MAIRRWDMPAVTDNQVAALQKATEFPTLLCRVLCARGQTNPEKTKAFLTQEPQLCDPYLLADMDKAVERIFQALEDGEHIAVFGDFDCDGMTSTALLTSYLQSIGADVIYYIPDREKEGYGLSNAAVDILHGQKVTLIVTVDNGISAHAEIAYAKTLGIDVVVTDHHTPRPTLPDAVAVVNPHRADCASTYKDLAGVGVAFKLVCALEQATCEEMLEHYADLVALGTIADIVPLTGENRTIVKQGLIHLQEAERPGVSALLEICGLSGKELTAERVAFSLIPRINAAGRMGCADDAVELLLTDDMTVAGEAAAYINGQNDLRKEIENQIVDKIEQKIAAQPELLSGQALIVSGEDWHHGVVGIAAAKLVDKYGKPCILFCIEGDEARGSGRSVEGVSLINAVSACSQHLTQYGGHASAVGLSLPVSRLDAFCRQLQAVIRLHHPVLPAQSCQVDAEIHPDELQMEQIAAFSALEPFGEQNRRPVFLLQGLRIDHVFPTNDGRHVRVRFIFGGVRFFAIYFYMSEEAFPYRDGDIVDVLADISIGEFRGKRQIEVKIKDLRAANAPQEEILHDTLRYHSYLQGNCNKPEEKQALLPERSDFAAVYKFLRRFGGYKYNETELFYRLRAIGIQTGYGRLRVALDVFEELGLIRRGSGISLEPAAGKVDMDGSEILLKLKA